MFQVASTAPVKLDARRSSMSFTGKSTQLKELFGFKLNSSNIIYDKQTVMSHQFVKNCYEND